MGADLLEPLRQKWQTRLSQLERIASHWNTLSSTVSHGFSPIVVPHILFEEGVFTLNGSVTSSDIVCLPLREAMRSFGPLLHNRASKESLEENDPLVALNGARQEEGLFIYVPESMHCSLNIHASFASPHLATPRIYLFLGRKAKADLTITYTGTAASIPVLDIGLEDCASLKMTEIALLHSDAKWYRALRASLKQSSTLRSFCYTEGAQVASQSARISLLEENARAELRGLAYLQEQRQADMQIEMRHLAPHCHSRQHFKTILLDESRAQFEGKIFVDPIAQKTMAYQLMQNLMLSDRAMAQAKPNLEIFADDVKASHGATFGQLDPESLFYCQTRGITAADAQKMLIEGFAKGLFAEIDSAPLRTYLEKRVCEI